MAVTDAPGARQAVTSFRVLERFDREPELVALFGAYDTAPDDIQTKFGEFFGDKNEHVALSAIATFGEMMKGAKSVAPRVEEALWMIAESSRSSVSAGSLRRAACCTRVSG